MASLILPATTAASVSSRNPQQQTPHCSIQSINSISLRLPSNCKSKLRSSIKGLRSHRSNLTLVKAQLNEVTGDVSPIAVANGTSKVGGLVLEKKDMKQADKPLAMRLSSSEEEESVAEFLAQVSALVKLVDSRDVMELQLKQSGCEVVIRKKEALPQPSLPNNGIMMMQSPPPAAIARPAPGSPAAAPTPVSSLAQAPAPSPPAGKPKSSHPPLKCPMAGSFYRCPAPGEPPFVKVGDKVQKGQIICIIEAMKLMNEIEADRTGTVVEILVEDGKPVSVDTPLFAIEP
ncbi:hypothetical protein ACHQM5_028303 [Ranunculus cassubicifolius]